MRLTVSILLAVVAAVLLPMIAQLSNNRILPEKLAIAVDLMGWDGLMNVTRENIATRLLGHKKTSSREAYHSLLNTLAEVDLKYLGPERAIAKNNRKSYWLKVISPDDIAEGHRMINHLLRTGMEFYVEQSPKHPKLRRYVSPTRKLMGDNPVMLMMMCVDFSLDVKAPNKADGYVIKGRRHPDEVYFSITLYGANTFAGFADRVIGEMNDRKLIPSAPPHSEKNTSSGVNDDASYYFELYITPERPVGSRNWLRLTPNVTCVITRHYFERVGTPAAVDPTVERRIDMRCGGICARKDRRKAQARSNQGKPAMWGGEGNNDDGGMGAVDIAYAAGFFKLEEGQSIELTGKIPKCAFANVVLWNRFLQSLDYEHRAVSLNRK
eukprot:jgi/Bigna1/134139/aug1.24_g8847